MSSVSRKEFLNLAKGFVKVAILTSCGMNPETNFSPDIIPEETTELSYFSFTNQWDYAVSINDNQLKNLAEEFGLILPLSETVNVSINNCTQRFFDPHHFENQNHTVQVNPGENPDKIIVSAGIFRETVKAITGSDPSTDNDQNFLSAALSEAIFNGLIDLSFYRGEITQNQSNHILNLYLDDLLYTDRNKDDLIIARVDISKDFSLPDCQDIINQTYG